MPAVRPERPADADLVREVHTAAFGRDGEARLVEAIRGGPDYVPDLSLVAEKDAHVVGHVLLSRLGLEGNPGDVAALALGPIGVLPDVQRTGIGAALMRHGITEAAKGGFRFIVLVGDPVYYGRFGFVPARPLGLDVKYDVPDEVFLVRALVPDGLTGVKGRVRYPAAFDDVA